MYIYIDVVIFIRRWALRLKGPAELLQEAVGFSGSSLRKKEPFGVLLRLESSQMHGHAATAASLRKGMNKPVLTSECFCSAGPPALACHREKNKGWSERQKGTKWDGGREGDNWEVYKQAPLSESANFCRTATWDLKLEMPNWEECSEVSTVFRYWSMRSLLCNLRLEVSCHPSLGEGLS